MNLTDQEIIELNELCSAVADNRLTDGQRERLGTWLAASEAARRYYVSSLSLSASLHVYSSEMHVEPAPPRLLTSWRWAWVGGSLAAAAAVVLVFFSKLIIPSGGSETAPATSVALVARISAAKDVQWQGARLAPGTLLQKGQNVELVSGYAEITFDSGARLVLEGPGAITVNSAWDTTLRLGTLKAVVPPQAIGFRISNPSVEVVDLGTEFTMIADKDGSTEVFVQKGEVEAAPRSSVMEKEVLLLRENEARRFERNRVSAVTDSEHKFSMLAQSPALERFVPSYRYAHWSFDDPAALGGRYRSDNDTHRLETVLEEVNAIGNVVSEGRWQRGLSLNSGHYAQTSFPGLSGSTPHTVAFWVRVPENAPLSEAYSIIGWRSSLPELGYRPVHISWNRNPNEGALGAIRTDFAGGSAIGRVSLRDGRWHHVAIVFVPGLGNSPVQVKQYVDGYLESSVIIPGRTRSPSGKPDPSLDDLLWIGTRLGATGPRQERFRGEIDELFIADGALQPQEIVRLQQDNRLEGRPTALVSR